MNRCIAFHDHCLPVCITPSSFEENIGPGGTLAAGFIHVNFEGSNTFKSNMGPGLRVSTVVCYTRICFRIALTIELAFIIYYAGGGFTD